MTKYNSLLRTRGDTTSLTVFHDAERGVAMIDSKYDLSLVQEQDPHTNGFILRAVFPGSWTAQLAFSQRMRTVASGISERRKSSLRLTGTVNAANETSKAVSAPFLTKKICSGATQRREMGLQVYCRELLIPGSSAYAPTLLRKTFFLVILSCYRG